MSLSFDFNAPQSSSLLMGGGEGGEELLSDLEAGVVAPNHFFLEQQQPDDQLEAYGRGEIPLEDLISHKKPMADSTNKPSAGLVKRPLRQVPAPPLVARALPVKPQPAVLAQRPASPKVDPRQPQRMSILPQPKPMLAATAVAVPRASMAASRGRTPPPPPIAAAPRSRTPPPPSVPAVPRNRTPSPSQPPAQRRPVMVMKPVVGPTTTASSSTLLLPTQHQYQPKTQAELAGRSHQPGYLTPTEASKSSFRNKFTPPAARASTPPPSRAPSPRPLLTTPKTPQLATRELRRHGSADRLLQTSEEMELQRIAREKQELRDRKVVEKQRVQRASLNPVCPPPAATQSQPFHLRVDSRLGTKSQAAQAFKSALEISSQVMSREAKCWVEPHVNPAALGPDVRPFTFASEARLRGSVYKPTEEMEWERVQQETAEEQYQRERRDQQRFELPVSTSATAAQSHPPRRLPTQPEPFKLEGLALHEQAQRALEERVQRERELEKEMHNFHALKYEGGAVMSHGTSTNHQQPVLTQPKGPSCVTRAQAAEEQRRQRLLREQKARDEAASRFRARALPSTTYGRGFVPAPSQLPLVEPKAPALKSQIRHAERAAFDSQQKEAEQVRALERQAREKQLALQEREQVRTLRKSLVHQARPVPATSRFSNAAVPVASTTVEFGGDRQIPEHDQEDDGDQEKQDEPIARRLRSSLGGAVGARV
ncbi:hypothetical protein BASA81_004420 [Batrachochytrium salamandrivorans]|nr:hypothetical protein BASA81_004420 [Batrachochytrium salamandrivorans]